MMKPFLTLRIFFSIMALTTAAFSASGGAGSESIEDTGKKADIMGFMLALPYSIAAHDGGAPHLIVEIVEQLHRSGPALIIAFDGLLKCNEYTSALSLYKKFDECAPRGDKSKPLSELQAHIHATVPTHLDELLAEAKIPQAKALFQAYFAFDHVKAEAIRGRFEDGVFSALEQLAKAHVQATYLGIPQPTRDPTALAGSFEGALRREAMRSVQEATKAESARLEARTMPVRGGAAAWNVAEVALEAPAGGTAAGGVPVAAVAGGSTSHGTAFGATSSTAATGGDKSKPSTYSVWSDDENAYHNYIGDSFESVTDAPKYITR